jgi:HTH-type transcriptional regulator/antitoxin HigA
MNVKPVRTQKDLREALVRIDQIIDAKHGTQEYDELEVLSTLVEAFEEKHCPIPPPDPVEAIKFRMDQIGLKQADIAKYLGGKNRASEVLSRKRPLSLRMIRNLHINLHIPSDSLLGITSRNTFKAKTAINNTRSILSAKLNTIDKIQNKLDKHIKKKPYQVFVG